MNEDEYYDDDAIDDLDDKQALLVLEKMMEAMMAFNGHFAAYIRENDEELFKRAIDYAKTFTEEDVSGVKLSYITEKEKDDNEKNTDS